MKPIKTQQKWIALFTVIALAHLFIIVDIPLRAHEKVCRDKTSAVSSAEPASFEKEGRSPDKVKQKPFPWIWVIAGVAVASTIAYLLFFSKPKYVLTVSKSDGVDGTPERGSQKIKRGTVVDYRYTLKANYKNLLVTLDDIPVEASGSFVMTGNHKLFASSSTKSQFTLNVNIDSGVQGTPIAGVYTHYEGQTVSYSFSAKPGYRCLEVKLDGDTVNESGTIIMNGNHILTATTIPPGTYLLTVDTDDGVYGSPSSGVHAFPGGTEAGYSYSEKPGYSGLSVKLDGIPAAPSGSVLMNGDHIITVTTAPPETYALTVIIDRGAVGTPDAGTYSIVKNSTVDYSYRAILDYKTVKVQITGWGVFRATDGVGSLVMDRDYTIHVLAFK